MSDDYKEYVYREPVKARYVEEGERLVTRNGVEIASEELVHVLSEEGERTYARERFEELFKEAKVENVPQATGKKAPAGSSK